MRLTYWHARNTRPDSSDSGIVAPTKKQALAEMQSAGADRYDQPVKKVVVYTSAFDLMQKAVYGGAGCGYV